jgi:hypothetical protein
MSKRQPKNESVTFPPTFDFLDIAGAVKNAIEVADKKYAPKTWAMLFQIHHGPSNVTGETMYELRGRIVMKKDEDRINKVLRTLTERKTRKAHP